MVIISGGALGLALTLAVQTESSERLYGRVLTAAGEQVEGWLRWDRNETHWADFLDGRKEVPREHLVEAERLDDELRRRREQERSIRLPGLRITWDEDDGAPPELTASAVRFGHLRSLEVTGERRAVVVLLSGERLELVSGSSDLGRGFRGLNVEDPARGEVEIEWRDLARVDFIAAPSGRAAPTAERLRGTVRTRGGLPVTGLVGWDLDETLTTDVLDGESDLEEVHIAFGDIASIAWESRSSARVRLVSGREMVLDGSKDVDESNRGIEITDPSLGRVIVDWDEFLSLDLDRRTEPAAEVARSDAERSGLDGGARLRGTVTARDGRRVSGFIRWDNDEEYAWELLDGRSDGVEVAIEMGRVRTIERIEVEGPAADDSESASRVTLQDGRAFMLEGTSDVGEDNRGIFIDTGAAGAVLVAWRDFLRADLEP